MYWLLYCQKVMTNAVSPQRRSKLGFDTEKSDKPFNLRRYKHEMLGIFLPKKGLFTFILMSFWYVFASDFNTKHALDRASAQSTVSPRDPTGIILPWVNKVTSANILNWTADGWRLKLSWFCLPLSAPFSWIRFSLGVSKGRRGATGRDFGMHSSCEVTHGVTPCRIS